MKHITLNIPVPVGMPGWVKRHKKWSAFIAFVVLVGGYGVSAMSGTTPPEYVTDTAKHGLLRQTVEAVGTVTSERDLELQFPVTGVVQDVSVTEGQTVRAGQVLARLKAGDLGASVASASARVASARAQLQAIEDGARPEDIAVTEADLANKKASLDVAKSTLATAETSLTLSKQKLATLKTEAKVGLAGQVAVAGSTLGIQFAAADSSLAVLDNLWRNNDILDAAMKSGNNEYDLIKQQRIIVGAAITKARSVPISSDYQDVLSALGQARLPITQTLDLVSRALSFVVALPETSSFTNADRESKKDDLLAEKSAMQDSLNDLDAATKALRDASASYETKIATEESSLNTAQGTKEKALADIGTYETAVRTAEAQLQLKKAGSRQTDIDGARASLGQAQADLARASAEYNKTVLTAPIDGVITKVIVKPGEILPSGPAVTLLGNAPFRVEMYVSEIDVPKIQRSQSGSIELDAFRGTLMKLRASDIDTAPTDRDGVSKYRIKLDFVHLHPELKIGMTGDAEIVTGVRDDVVHVPLRSVLERSDGTQYVRVLGADQKVEERTVTTGMEGEGGDVEVTGVAEGETIIVLEKS